MEHIKSRPLLELWTVILPTTLKIIKLHEGGIA